MAARAGLILLLLITSCAIGRMQLPDGSTCTAFAAGFHSRAECCPRDGGIDSAGEEQGRVGPGCQRVESGTMSSNAKATAIELLSVLGAIALALL